MEHTDQKFTNESILLEMIDFLEYRKEQMDQPYIIVGEQFVDPLCEHYDKLGEGYKVEVSWKNNIRFLLLTNQQ